MSTMAARAARSRRRPRPMFSRFVVGWAVSAVNDRQARALAARRSASPGDVRERGLPRRSMGRYDNAVMESFFS